jgi:sarcosine oxidase subunit beta
VIEQADVIVVGGGILGCCAALHLLDRGIENVVLVERDGLAQGTSHAGAGFIGKWAGGYVPQWTEEELEIEAYGLDFYRALAEDHGLDIGYKRNGNLWVATSDEAWKTHIEPIADNAGVPERQVLSPGEVQDITGIIPADGVVGGLLHPHGAQLSAPLAARAVASQAEERGARILSRRPIEGLRVENGRVTGVDTTLGPIAAEAVVLATGVWTNKLLEPHDVWLPMAPLTATRIITEPIGVPGSMPTLMLQEYSAIWLREAAGGLLWGCSYTSRPRREFVDTEVPERFDHLPLDAVFETQRAGVAASQTIPVLSRYQSMTVAQAAPAFTADLRALLGRVEEVEGLFVMTGDNEAGITHGPGYGRLIAELVVDGASGFVDADVFRPGRFEDRYRTVADVANAVEGSDSIFAIDASAS